MQYRLFRGTVRFTVLGSVLFVCLATPATTRAQTPMGIRNVSKDAGVSAQAIAANNPWFGAQVAHRFGTEGEFESNLLAAGQFLYEIKFKVAEATTGTTDPTDPTAAKPAGTAKQSKAAVPFLRKFHLPVVSNFGGDIAPDSAEDAINNQIKELLSSASGVTAGLFPYYELRESDNLMLTLHGLFAWRYNSFKPLADDDASTEENSAETDETELVPLHQVKTGIGLEAIIGDRSDGKGGLTVSLTPVLTWFTDKAAYKRAFGEERSSLRGIEVVGIIPVSDKGVGVVLEGVAASGGKRSFRAGLMIVGKPK
jgi:hypothetical protein